MYKFFRPLVACMLAAGMSVSANAADMSSTATLVRPAPGGAPWTASQIAQLRRDVARDLSASTLRGAQVGLVAIDTVRGSALFSQLADSELMPASNFKLLAGSAALARLGTGFAYRTAVYADAPAQSGTIAGNLYLRGGGDALLRATDLDAAAAAIASAGVKEISGSVVTDASHFDAQRWGYGWSWDDLPYYYAPPVSALELEDGIVHVHMTSGSTLGAPVTLRVEPQSDAFAIDNQLVTGASDTSQISRVWDRPRTIVLSGNYGPVGAKESGDLSPAVPDVESYAGDVFARALAAHGIRVTGAMHAGKAPQAATLLWTHDSEALPQMLADFWYPSDNLMGELFLKQLGVFGGGEPGTDAKGAAVENAWLASIGVDPTTVTIEDGSGLSQYDRITPEDLLKILQADWNSPNRNVVLDALPVTGVRGSLKSSYAGTPAYKTVFAKTGSISHVRTISGFIRTKTHGAVTFSFMVNGWMGESRKGGSADLAKVRAAVLSEFAKR